MPSRRESSDTKALRGTNRRDREQFKVVALPEPSDLPKAPAWVQEGAARDEFDRLARHLHAAGVLTELGVHSLAHLASVHGALVRAWENGVTPQSALLSQYRLLSQEFGLTPATMTRLPAPLAPKQNRFQHLGRRPSDAG